MPREKETDSLASLEIRLLCAIINFQLQCRQVLSRVDGSWFPARILRRTRVRDLLIIVVFHPRSPLCVLGKRLASPSRIIGKLSCTVIDYCVRRSALTQDSQFRDYSRFLFAERRRSRLEISNCPKRTIAANRQNSRCSRSVFSNR